MGELNDQFQSRDVSPILGRYAEGSGLDELSANDKVRRYTEYYLATRPSLKAYLSSFLGANEAAIEDCIQEAGLVVWSKWDAEWDLDAFQKFSFVTGRFKALSWLKKHKPAQQMTLSPVLMESLAAKSLEVQRDGRLDKLKQCMERLTPEHRQILEARYEDQSSKAVNELAKKMGRSVDAMYKQLERLRTVLRDCVSKNPMNHE